MAPAASQVRLGQQDSLVGGVEAASSLWPRRLVYDIEARHVLFQASYPVRRGAGSNSWKLFSDSVACGLPVIL